MGDIKGLTLNEKPRLMFVKYDLDKISDEYFTFTKIQQSAHNISTGQRKNKIS